MWHIVICHNPINVVWLSILDDRYSNSHWQSLTDSSDTATWLQIPFKPIFISVSACSKQIRLSRSLQSRECFTKALPYFFSNVLDLLFSFKLEIEKQNTYQLVLYLSLHVLLGPGWLWSDISHKNIVRHTAHTIVSWPNPKQWLMIHTSGLMMIIR